MGLSIESDIGHMAIHSGFGVGIPRNFRTNPFGAYSICVDLAIFILLLQLPSPSMEESTYKTHGRTMTFLLSAATLTEHVGWNK